MPQQQTPFRFPKPKSKSIEKKHWTRASYFAIREQKLSQQAPKPQTDILSGTAIYFTGVKSTSQRRLEALIHLNGGKVLKQWHRTRVTHVIADSLAASKIQTELSTSNHSAPIVKPTWILESLRARRKLHTWPFQLVQGPPDVCSITQFFQTGKAMPLIAASEQKHKTLDQQDNN